MLLYTLYIYVGQLPYVSLKNLLDAYYDRRSGEEEEGSMGTAVMCKAELEQFLGLFCNFFFKTAAITSKQGSEENGRIGVYMMIIGYSVAHTG